MKAEVKGKNISVRFHSGQGIGTLTKPIFDSTRFSSASMDWLIEILTLPTVFLGEEIEWKIVHLNSEYKLLDGKTANGKSIPEDNTLNLSMQIDPDDGEIVIVSIRIVDVITGEVATTWKTFRK